MKTYSTSELKEKANEVFAQYPTVNEVYATPDGNVFIQKNRAELHAKQKDIRVKPFERELKGDSKATKTETVQAVERPNVTDTQKLIDAVTTLEGLDEYRQDDRKTVQKAVAAKEAALKDASNDDTDKEKQSEAKAENEAKETESTTNTAENGGDNTGE
ncbi:hypothetical protein [Flavobacterium beibuense]|uniref:hypothetical protein n=1 Tax=Flavobacterium beibuense TaxID=657326 RepID=UPI003A95B926